MIKKQVCISLCVFVLLCSCGTLAEETAKAPIPTPDEVVKGDLAKRVDAYFSRIVPFGFSGAILVAKEGKILLNKGYGLAIRSRNIPNTSDTVFSTGSVTKQFTAAGIMKLEMLGKLKNTDPISKFFPDVPEDKKGITLHHLLTHTSGVVDGAGPDFVVAERDGTIRKILSEPLQFSPGERFSYSNAGFSLLAAVIELVSGETYEEFMYSQLFKPAGMEFTGYRRPDWSRKTVAHWYRGEKDNGTPLEKPYPYWNILGNGGILSTTSDMLRWHQALLGEKVLSAAVKKKMFTPFLNEYGYGWDVIESGRGLLIQHDGGSTLGSSSEMRRFIDAGIVTMLFCNQSFGQGTLMEMVRDKLNTLVFGGDLKMPPQVKAADPKSLERYTGEYAFSQGGAITVSRGEHGLSLKPKGQAAVNALFALGPETAKQHEQWGKTAAEVFKSAAAGDYEPLFATLAARERREGPVKDLVDMRMQRYHGRTGDIVDVLAPLTILSNLDGREAAMTIVELKGEKGSFYFSFYWKDGKNIGIAPSMGVPNLTIPFSWVSGHEFAGYHLEMEKSFRVSFQETEGRITGLSVSTAEGALTAKRMK
jgi:CubicO group peptidase (beta-lactamase class C family)